jgi:hypothetical protein
MNRCHLPQTPRSCRSGVAYFTVVAERAKSRASLLNALARLAQRVQDSSHDRGKLLPRRALTRHRGQWAYARSASLVARAGAGRPAPLV